ncbi:hypothetical protein P4S63_02140 [Pseudoalteromonas sp. B193]
MALMSAFIAAVDVFTTQFQQQPVWYQPPLEKVRLTQRCFQDSPIIMREAFMEKVTLTFSLSTFIPVILATWYLLASIIAVATKFFRLKIFMAFK